MNVRQVIPRDAIPSVDDPRFVDEYGGDAGDQVIVVEADPPRAYPVRYLHYHEIVNDRVDEGPVAVTWCPLCGSAVVYDSRVEGRELEFGVSGKLADDDLVMYDRQTESEWKQSTGRAIAGPLEGSRLTVLPAAMTTWERFAADHPGGVVLAPPGGASEASGAGHDPEPIDYDAGPYDAYFEREGFGLAAHRSEGAGRREWNRDDLDPKAVVLGIEHGDEALGVALERVRSAGGVVQTRVGGLDVVVFASADELFAYEDPGIAFEPVDGDGIDPAGGSGDDPAPQDGDGDEPADGEGDEPADGDGLVGADTDGAGTDDGPRRFVGDGTRWDPATGESSDGRRLERLPARRLFAFTWQDDHGSDSFYR